MSALESLATEILDVILVDADASDVTRLMRCNSNLQRRLEPALHGQKVPNDKSMRWACLNGVDSSIRRAVSYGASVTATEVPRYLISWESDGNSNIPTQKRISSPAKVLNLYLATKGGRAETFKLLLGLGARLDEDDVNVKQVKRLLKLVCLEKNRSILNLLFESGIHTQVRRFSAADWCLTRIIKNGAPVDYVRLLLDYGADPNRVELIKRQRLCPISAAIIANSEPIFDLLLERGANVNGKDHGCTSMLLPWNIPIFAAAQSMNKNGERFLLKCLDHGANINHAAHFFAVRKFHGWYHRYSMSTPISVYIDSIESWDMAQALRPFTGVTLLLESGALLEYSTIAHNSPHCGWRSFDAPTIVQTLLGKWGLDYLRVSEFFRTAELLTQEGISNKNFIQLSVKHQSDAHLKGEHSELITQRWKSLLNKLLESKEATEKNQLFLQYFLEIWREGMEAVRPRARDFLYARQERIVNVHSATMKALLDSGININSRMNHPEGRTALHHICEYENFIEGCQRSYINFLGRASPIPRRAKETQEMIEILLLNGADPMLLYKGQNSLEMLLCNKEKFTIEGMEYILGLVDILRKFSSGRK